MVTELPPLAAWSLYTAPSRAIDAALVGAFLADQAVSRLFTESRTLEFKRERRGDSVARAIAALANTEGGIILLGVDEKNPDLATSPGVPASEVVAVADSCRQVLQPALEPELIPVPVPGTDRVVLVIRVEYDPRIRPVLRSGTAFVRAPGQTVPASREQLLEMLRGSEVVSGGTAGIMSLASTFAPRSQLVGAGDETCDFSVRVAGGLWLRPTAAAAFVMGTAQREAVLEAFAGTAFSLLPSHHDQRSRFSGSAIPCLDRERSSTLYRTAITYAGSETHRVALTLVKEGPRVGYAVDLEARVFQVDAGPAPPGRIGRFELAASLLAGLGAVSLQLPDAVATVALDAPRRLDFVHAWIMCESGISSLLDMTAAWRPVPREVGNWGFECEAVTSREEAAERVGSELQRLYLDLGMDYEVETAHRDVEQALSVCSAAESTHRPR